MPINGFCKNCAHRKIPTSLKQKFNEYVKYTFIHCPQTDKNVAFCFIKEMTIDWKAFVRWCDDNKLMTEDEKRALKVLKLLEEKDA